MDTATALGTDVGSQRKEPAAVISISTNGVTNISLCSTNGVTNISLCSTNGVTKENLKQLIARH